MLYPVTGDKDKVLAAMANAVQAFNDNNAVVREKLANAFPDPGQREDARKTIINNLQQGLQDASQAQTDPKWFTPRDAMAALAQSAMNQRVQQPGAQPVTARAVMGAAAAPALALFEQFSVTDPGWIECVVDAFKTLFTGKAPFVQHQNLTDFLYAIPDQVTIALVADWGGHNDAARRVADQIRAAQPDITIHLGDIYYAGQENEAKEALGIWPMADRATGAIAPRTSFAMNGNHEMYSGGWAYFGDVFHAFGQEASYFGLRNNNWQILACDTAYLDFRLPPPDDMDNTRLHSQWNWLVDKMRNSTLPTILLSHHEPISAFSDENSGGVNLRADFQKFLTASGRQVFGWFFGHEHRCTIYDDPNLSYLGRLIGHGCIPHTPPPLNQEPDPGCAHFSDMNHRANQDGDAVSGFALLKFDGRNIGIRYIDEDGALFKEEIWEAPLPG